jgi:hypothetical protein
MGDFESRGPELGRHAPFFETRTNLGKRSRMTLIFFVGAFRHHAAVDEILEFLVSPETEHFISAAGGIARVEIRVDEIVKRLEFERAFLRQDRTKLFRHDVGGAASKSGMVSHDLSRFFFNTTGRKPKHGHERVVRENTGRDLKTQVARDDFTEGDISQAHSGRRRDQGPVAAHQLPNAQANNIDEEMLVRDDGDGAVEKSGLH